MSVPNQIHSYLLCARCIEDSYRSDVEVGLTPTGIQVWCRTHNINIAILDPDGLKFLVENRPKCNICERGVKHTH